MTTDTQSQLPSAPMPEHLGGEPEQEKAIAQREQPSAPAKVSKWETPLGAVEVTPALLRQMFNCPDATDFEIFQFVQLCRLQRLNPFTGDAYLIKYGKGNPASFVVGKATFTQRAEAHSEFDGLESGIVVQRGETIEMLDGTLYYPGDVILGGWAQVYRKDRRVPLKKMVTFTEYDTGRSLWKSKPGTMIEKVAIVQALREAFPTSFAGLYDSSEMGQDLPEIREAS